MQMRWVYISRMEQITIIIIIIILRRRWWGRLWRFLL